MERHTGKEVNSQKGGKTGTKVKVIKGPVGKLPGNPTKSGGITQPTKGKLA